MTGQGEPENLPAVPDPADPAVPLEGKVLRPGVRPREAAVRARTAIVGAATDRRTKAVARNVAYVAQGAQITVKRLWDSRSTARYDRMMRAAEATGDTDRWLEVEARKAAYQRDRHGRRMDILELPAKLIVGLRNTAIVVVAVLGVLGGAAWAATGRAQEIRTPFLWAAKLLWLIGVTVSVTWLWLLLTGSALGLLALWNTGRNRGVAPAWAATSADTDVDLAIDETTIARALEALRIPQITAYLKQGLPLQFITPARRDGRGTHAVLRLPAGVTADRIARRRADLATGLHRLAKETWPSTGSEAGILDLWIADKGVLAEGAGPYPLLDDGFTDVFKGVPFGKVLRGDPIVAPIMERNTIIGGIPGQGKSAGARAIMAGCALDPTAELRIWVPDTNFDFEAFRPRCSRYVMGAENEKIAQIRDDLLELYAEVQERGNLLIRYKVPAVTRELANAGVGLHPLVCLLEEAHIAITHAKYGKEISQLLIDIVRLGRKRGIHLIPSTQAPTKDSMPRDVTRNCSNGIAFAVGDHVANDALLGQGAYAAGHRATELIPGVDRGTAVVKGFSGERSEIVQVYYLDASKGNDQVTPIIERSLAEIARRGVALPAPAEAAEQRDLLDDLDEVLGGERVKLSDLPARLRERFPHWAPYRTLTGSELRRLLTAEGVRTTHKGNVPRLDPRDLREVLARRTDEG